ncbi:MAG: NAD(P)-dependent alcohol dehydrogenase [Salinibacterium sp.]|nr:NAD(P)-dependent alcohol dehydrogenase [Salinibacterium sp.]
MRAIVQDGYGTTEVLRVREIPTPVAGPGQVLLRVRAAGVDMAVWHGMTGTPLLARLGFGLLRPRRAVLGGEVAGIVEAVGDGVTRFAPGDEVFGVAQGSFAEFTIAKERDLATMPTTLDFEQSAALPISALTAVQAVERKARVGSGQSVLVLGAGGGVGTFAVQLAVAAGATVTGVCSAGKAALVRSLGGTTVIDYRNTPVTGKFDVIIDTAGQRPIPTLSSLLTTRGIAVIVGGEGGGTRLLGGFSRSIFAPLSSRKKGKRVVGLVSLTTASDLERVRTLAEAGSLVPAIDTVYALEDAGVALERLNSGSIAGKAVLRVSS